MKLITLILTVVLLKSCGNTKGIASSQNKEINQLMELVSGSYVITKLGADEIFPVELTLEIDSKANTISGFSGCNRFMGSYTVEGNKITCSQLISTKAFCQPEVNRIERKLLEYLNTPSAYKIQDEALILMNESEEVILTGKKQTVTEIIYQQSTRGVFERIWIDKDSISYSNDRELLETKTSVCNTEDWDVLMRLCQAIDVKSVPELEPPTKKFQYDAAAMGTLEIRIGNEIYKTKIFDHGQPPKAISELVNKLLSMKNMVQKE